MNVPYTTKAGIKIGCRYRENGTVMPIEDRDMQLIQEALLATPNYIRSKRIHQWTIALSAMVLVGSIVATFLFN